MSLNLQGLSKGGKGIESLAENNIPITTDNLAINFGSGRANVFVMGNHFKALQEVADLVGELELRDPDKAEAIERAFHSAKSEDETYIFRVADFLEERLKSITPMQALFENSWEEAKEEAAYLLANQLENVFRIYRLKGETKLFEEFADEVKDVYKDIAAKAKEIAIQELSEQDAELGREFEKAFDKAEKGRKRKRKVAYGLALAALGLAALGGLYYQFVYKPEQAKKPYKQAGLTDEQAERFVDAHPSQNGNSTWVSFAKYWVENQSLADSTLRTFKDLNKSLSYLSSSNNQQFLAKALDELGSNSYSFVELVNGNK
ncbi:MAG: hypothetical protein FGF53_06325, partial [Candidatus Brockarchaeota archaeon]|nr:hypothetical protein [Candidatus Brockarchaeota archaeon]